MSFLREVKDEILYKEENNLDCVIAEIHGLLNQNYKINVSKKISLTIIKENEYFVKRFSFLVTKYLDERFEIKVIRSTNATRKYSYIIYFDDAESFLRKIKLLKDSTFVFNRKDILIDRDRIASYLRGEFFVCGIFADPNKNYHLEFRKNDFEAAKKLREYINTFKLNAKITQRKSYFIVYIKEADKISDFLKVISAYNGVLNLESLIVLKDMKNNVNRLQNCDLANLNKTISASVKHINDIEYIYENYGENYLPEDLKKIADVRIKFPDSSLVEIGKEVYPPITKSSVNYKLKKISKIALSLRGE